MELDPKELSPEQKQIAILAELNRGAKGINLANKYDVNPNTIGNWKRKARTEAAKASVQELAEVDPVVVETVIQEVKAKAATAPDITTKQAVKLDKGLNKLSDGLDGLAMLDTEIQKGLLKALQWANRKITDDMKISEWTQIVDGITRIHGTLNGKAGLTQVNIQNNSAGDSDFKSGMRL